MSLRGARAKKRSRFSLQPKKPLVRYGRFHVPGNWKISDQEEFLTISRLSKVLLLSLVIIPGILLPSFAYYQFNIVPSLNVNSNYDPFTLLWNGTTPAVSQSGNGPIAFKSLVNATCFVSCGGIPIDTVLPLPAFTVGTGDTLIVEIYNDGPYNAFVVTDTQGNTFTQKASSITGLGGFSGQSTHIYSASASATGSDTITTSTSGGSQQIWGATASDYSGSIGFGNTATQQNDVSDGTSGTSTITITAAATSSFVVEAFLLGGTGGVAPRASPASSQTLRNEYSLSGGIVDTATEITGISGASSLGISFSAPSGGTFWSHVGLELTSVPSLSNCPQGYNCQLATTDNVGNLKLTANATFPGIAVTKSPVDVATSSAKELFFYETWHNATNLSVASPFGWFLTVNGTLPSQSGYFPLNDTSVVLAIIVYPNAGDTSKNYYEYMAKAPGQGLLRSSGSVANPYPTCPQTSTIYLCAGSQTVAGTQYQAISTTLNYTGNAGNVGANGFSLLCVDATPAQAPPTSNFCSSATQTPTLSPCTGSSQEYCATTLLPFLNIQSGPFYLGFWSSASQSATIQFGSSSSGAASQRANSIWYWVPNPSCPPTCSVTDTGGYFGWLGKALGGAWDAVSGVFSPIVTPILNAGNSLMLAFATAFSVAGSYIVNGFITLLNSIGNLVGFGPIGTDLANLIAGGLTLLSNGLVWLITGLTWIVSLAARANDIVTILVTWAGPLFATLISWTLAGVNSIGFVATILYWGFLGISLLIVTLEILLFFLLVGDYGGEGFIAWFETSKWFIFGTGIRLMTEIFNFGLDIISAVISILPKPFVQMSGIAHWPRIPIFIVGGSPTLPNGSMEAARSGNLFTMFGWIVGMVFTLSYESSTLPGSIAGLVPAAAPELTPIATLLNLFYVVLFLAGTMLIFLLPAQLANAFPILDLGRVPGRSVKLSVKGPGVSVSHIAVKRGMAKRRFKRFVSKRLEAKKLIERTVEEQATA